MKHLQLNNMVNLRGNDGFFQLFKDKEAIIVYTQYIEENSLHFDTYEEKINYLISNKYYIDFFQYYDIAFINKLAADIYSHNFKFKSFMAISKFYNSYSLKTYDNKKFLEHYEDRIIAIALYLAQGNTELAQDIGRALITQQYQPATPTFLNSGKNNSGELVSCFLIDVADSLNSITHNISTSMQLSKVGGGVALNLSNLRGRGETIANIENIGRGVLPVMKILEDSFNYVDQLGQRPGAGAAYLNIFHIDVIEFLDSKKINSDEKARIQTLSIGLLVPDKFMELAKENKDIHFFYPYNVYQEYKINFSEIDITSMYDELLANPRIKTKKMSARKFLQQIAHTQFESGYPYLVFIDNANRENPLSELGKIKMSNLCTEIFQIQETSVINDYGIEDEVKYDVNCNLGSLNIVNFLENDEHYKTIKIAMQSLSMVSDLSDIPNAPGVNKANRNLHSVGLGLMNLHGFFTKYCIAYESEEAIDFINTFSAMINYYSLMASCEIAKERQTKFTGFDKSNYASGVYFDKYLNNEFLPQTRKIEKLYQKLNIFLPTIEEWRQLKEDIQTHGLYNAYRLAIAPTQSISYIQNSTASIMPITSLIETRIFGDSITYYPMPYLTKENTFFYKSAYNMDQLKIIDLVAAAQQHIDQGISTILFITNQHTTADLARYYYYAWAKGLKSLYYTRRKNLTIAECESCSV